MAFLWTAGAKSLRHHDNVDGRHQHCSIVFIVNFDFAFIGMETIQQKVQIANPQNNCQDNVSSLMGNSKKK